MSLNWTMLSPERTPVPLPHETTITTLETNVELTVIVPDAPPSRSAPSGGSGGSKKMKEVGRLWLTDQRLIFVAAPSASFESLSVPLHSILSTKFEQPYFGANYVTIDIKPSPEGGLTDGTKAEIRVKDQGLFGFVSVLEKTRERAIYMKRQAALDEEALRKCKCCGDQHGDRVAEMSFQLNTPLQLKQPLSQVLHMPQMLRLHLRSPMKLLLVMTPE
ncbi:hypothetical protein PUNSTDRAFT_64772 [Punctularia strigosozonata HHB-11173 SS5]|uniref:uncharacterized protein n=1 Tax=Punctularia strigosozonata (strain HHB-11173) TaxID=741275 RepID=UPI00044177C9|nr:uncharacterized protein PUNSTDRAFT_64772 [Punctularia strigosozonata HHB-11173 SS5]EIN11054.1 hypothetical protein PUNSTDRAFT_64772 [Punctularia strigosozonata HHB-11173 SS5]